MNQENPFPNLTRKLRTNEASLSNIIQSPYRKPSEDTNPVMIQTKNLVSGILVMSEFEKKNPEIKGQIRWELNSLWEYRKTGVSFRFLTLQGSHLIGFCFVYNPNTYTYKIGRERKEGIEVIHINDVILSEVMSHAERYCLYNPCFGKGRVIHDLPYFKEVYDDTTQTSESIIIASTVEL